MVIESYENLVNTLSYEFSRKFRMVEIEDIRQEMWVWFLEHPNKVVYWEENYDNKECTKLIARSLRNAAKDYCQKEKAVKLGYRVEDLYYYDKELLEIILPAVLTGNMSAPSFTDLGFTKSRKVLSEGGNWLSMCADVERAWESLQEDQQAIISLKYGLGMDGSALAAELKISADAVRMRINRALKSLLTYLGGDKPKFDKDYKEKQDGRGQIDTDTRDGEVGQDSDASFTGEEV